MTLLVKPDEVDPAPLVAALGRHLAGREVRLYPQVGRRDDIVYALVHAPPPGLLGSLPNLRAVFSLWAGIDHLASEPRLPKVPVVRMVDRGMTATMTAHVVQQVLAFHGRRALYAERQRRRQWLKGPLTAPFDRRVGILGLGTLGRDAARKLAALGFDVAGWSRGPKRIAGMSCLSGAAGLARIARRSEILVCLLPLTAETEGMLNARLFALLPRGAFVINCARGGHLVEADLLDALASGQLAGAALDVMAEEPPAPDHPFWDHPAIVLTPHAAAFSTPETAAEAVAANIARIERGEAPHGVVDFARGY